MIRVIEFQMKLYYITSDHSHSFFFYFFLLFYAFSMGDVDVDVDAKEGEREMCASVCVFGCVSNAALIT